MHLQDGDGLPTQPPPICLKAMSSAGGQQQPHTLQSRGVDTPPMISECGGVALTLKGALYGGVMRIGTQGRVKVTR